MGGALAAGGLGLTGSVLALIFTFLAGGNITDVIGQLDNLPVQNQRNINTGQFEGEDEYEQFASAVLGSNNEMWTDLFSRSGKTYSPPKLVLFRDATRSSCGAATSEVGPHYCPLDETIYLDETFFDELTRRFGAQGGDVAEAYVIAHETAHHAQNELNIMDQVQSFSQTNPEGANELSVKLELQADCFAGLWANSIKDLDIFEPGEIQEAIDAAAAVGDDRIQRSTTGRVNPESWTHGSSEQRVSWFNRGYEQGTFSVCDTFR
jgi:predicted metalloprotease